MLKFTEPSIYAASLFFQLSTIDYAGLMIEASRPEIRSSAGLIKSVAQFFSDKVFRVPEYQRNYSWERYQWEDFWNDIKDGFETKTSHYWGTITLEVTDEEKYCEQKYRKFKVYRMVDGQQRIATLYLFMLALHRVGNLPVIKEDYILTGNIYRLELSGPNGQALKYLVDGRDQDVDASLKTNRLLTGALEYFRGQLRSFGRVNELASYVLNDTYVLEFVVQDPMFAIKTFEVLNDRGKPLSLLDKTKSYLMFMCYKYIKNSEERRILTDLANKTFGKIFAGFDIIKEVGEKEEIDYIKRGRFTEDELLRLFYHYFAYYAVEKYQLPHYYHYDASAESVFSDFLKQSCMSLKEKEDTIKAFIKDFLISFEKFTSAFVSVVSKTNNNIKLKKLLSLLGLNAYVYPLLISTEAEDLLTYEMLDAIECLDVRVYKVRGTEPRAELYKNVISQIKRVKNSKVILEGIRGFIKYFMPDAEFQSYLNGLMSKNPAIRYILWEYEKYLNPSFNDSDFNLFNRASVEHIFPWQPTFNFPAYGFKGEHEYYREVDKIGNLTLLESPLNEKAGNRPPQEKASIYIESKLEQTRRLGFFITNHQIDKDFIERRKEEIIKFCLNRWKI
jgi:uncharacterized protein with ParB-like and HNH nuclease domain